MAQLASLYTLDDDAPLHQIYLHKEFIPKIMNFVWRKNKDLVDEYQTLSSHFTT